MRSVPRLTYRDLKAEGHKNAVLRAEEYFRQYQEDDVLWATQYLVSQWKEDFAALGVHAEEWRWCYSYSQGDGSSWKGWINIQELLDAKDVPGETGDWLRQHFDFDKYMVLSGWDIDNYVTVSVQYSRYGGQYVHEKTAEVEMEIRHIGYYSPSPLEKFLFELRDDLEELRLQLCKEFHRRVEDLTDEIYSDAWLLYQEQLFYVDGEPCD